MRTHSSKEGRRKIQKERTEPHGSRFVSSQYPAAITLWAALSVPPYLNQQYRVGVRGSTPALLALTPASPSCNGNTVVLHPELGGASKVQLLV